VELDQFVHNGVEQLLQSTQVSGEPDLDGVVVPDARRARLAEVLAAPSLAIDLGRPDHRRPR
jgi:hypothetical protein